MRILLNKTFEIFEHATLKKAWPQCCGPHKFATKFKELIRHIIIYKLLVPQAMLAVKIPVATFSISVRYPEISTKYRCTAIRRAAPLYGCTLLHCALWVIVLRVEVYRTTCLILQYMQQPSECYTPIQKCTNIWLTNNETWTDGDRSSHFLRALILF